MIDLIGINDAKIAKTIIIESINNTVWAEDVYPGLKEHRKETVWTL